MVVRSRLVETSAFQLTNDRIVDMNILLASTILYRRKRVICMNDSRNNGRIVHDGKIGASLQGLTLQCLSFKLETNVPRVAHGEKTVLNERGRVRFLR